jgi:hypothetical protein
VAKKDLMIKLCQNSSDLELTEHFEGALQPLALRNVFNPSFYLDGKLKIFGFRAIPKDNDWLMSYISVDDGAKREVRNISYDLFDVMKTRRLIDPKIFRLGEDIFATFNSGWIPGGNDLYVMKVHPHFETPKRLSFEGRCEQERNWAFFEEQGEIFALYSISPLRILRLVEEDATSWRMEEFFCGDGLSLDLSIGTPLSGGRGKYDFVAHKKLFWGRKKLYLGRYCHFDFLNKTIIVGKKWLFHSLGCLLGNATKHNTNLISCTYFSGIRSVGNWVSVAYGINDVDWGFSSFQKTEL